MSETVDCRACGGSGQVPKPCELCKGRGYMIEPILRRYGDHYTFYGQRQKRCPNGCNGPILRNSAIDVLAEF